MSEMQFVKDENYFQIQGWMRTKLNLTGNELLIFAIIFGFSQDGETKFYGSIDYLSEFAGTSRPTTIKVLKSLLEKGLITRERINTNHGYCYSYKAYRTKSKDSEHLESDFQELKNDSQELRNDHSSVKNSDSSVKNCYFKSKDSLPNNNNNNNSDNKTDNKNNNKGEQPPAKKEKALKHKHGEFNNVLLTDDEYQKLVDKLGKEKADAVIKNFSELKEMKGYKYNSDYMALLKWGIRAYEDNNRYGSPSKPNYNSQPFHKGFDREALNRKISLLDGVEPNL